MKIKGFFLGHFLSSSPITHVSGKKSLFSSNSTLSFIIFRHFDTQSVTNREKKKPGLENIRNLDDAFRSYENISRMRPLPSVKLFTHLLSRVVNLKEYSAAIHLFKDITCNLGVSVNEYNMTIAINSYCLSNRVDFGFSILGWFFKRGCVPNSFTFNALLKGLFQENRIKEAQELFRKIAREGLCELDVVTYGTVIDGLCKAGNTAMAIEFLREMEKGSCEPGTHIYSMLIDGLCKEKMLDSALKLFDEMSEKGITPNVVTCSSLMDGYCLLGRLNEARNVFDYMVTMNIAPNIWSYSILINGYCKKNKIIDAIDILREMPRKGLKPNVVTYNTILQGLFRGGRCSEALEIFDELLAVGLKPDCYTYCNMLNGLCRNGQVERASLLLDELEHKEGEPLHMAYYTIIVDGFCKTKKIDAARAVFRDLAAKGMSPNVVTYNIMIKGCLQNGLPEEAKDLLVEMEQASLLPSEATYKVIVQGFLTRGEYDDAAKFLEEMVAKGLSPSSSMFELLLDSLDINEHDSPIRKIIRVWAPSTLNRENGSKN